MIENVDSFNIRQRQRQILLRHLDLDLISKITMAVPAQQVSIFSIKE
jgi:hypothetical protein